MNDKKEGLTSAVLESLTSKVAKVPEHYTRPQHSLFELLVWSKNKFYSLLGSEYDKVTTLLQGSIVIDHMFMEYVKQSKSITISPIVTDAHVSFDNAGKEDFSTQGFFLISEDNLKFITALVQFKSESYDDQSATFILVENSNYEKYVEFRNKYTAWLKKKNRDSQAIHIAGLGDQQYTKDSSWDDLFLPEDQKKEIKSMVETFLSSKKFYEDNKIPWKRGLILHGPPGCGKSSIIKTIMSQYDFKPVTITAHANDEDIMEAFQYAEEQSPSLLFFEDLDSLLEGDVETSAFLNLMDGISSKNGIFVVATANNISGLKKSITDRPSRFDRKIEVSLPNKDLAEKYLKRWFGTTIKPKKLVDLSLQIVKNKLSFAYIKEIYISSVYEAIADGRQKVTNADVEKSMTRILLDKKQDGRSAIDTSKYLD